MEAQQTAEDTFGTTVAAEQTPGTSVAESLEVDARVDLNETPVGRTVRSIGHGGTFVPDGRDGDGADPRMSMAPLLPRTEMAILYDYVTGRFDATTSFDYLFRTLRARFPESHLGSADAAEIAATVAALKALGTAMIEPPGPDAARDSTIPAVYTYLGQFIDHDITLNTNGPDRAPEPGRPVQPGDLALGDVINDPFEVFAPDTVVKSLHNGRHPFLNLDSLYGSGPRFPGEENRPPTRSEAAYATADPAKLALGRISTQPIPGFSLVEPGDDAQRDLPRIRAAEADDERVAGKARIPDGRNDENLIVAQLHLGLIRFHNAAVDWVRRVEPWLTVDDRAVFDRAQQLVRFHYQWLVVHDYLRTLTKPGVLDTVLHEQSLLFKPHRRISMPLEFAVAAFRFGHSMVRNAYDYNVNFTFGGPAGPATLDQLFLFTGGGGLSPNPANPSDVLPSNWPIDWTRFVDKGDPNRARGARKIDPFLAADLADMLKEGRPQDDDPNLPPPTPDMRLILKQLAQRNLLRGYMLALPTGEEVARALHVTPLTREELTRGADAKVGETLDTLGGTPLWYYVLKEAEIEGNGNFLGEVGSRILCETFVYLISKDDESYMRHPGGWSPADGVRHDDGRMITTWSDMLRFAGVLAFKDGTFRTENGHPAGHDGDA